METSKRTLFQKGGALLGISMMMAGIMANGVSAFFSDVTDQGAYYYEAAKYYWENNTLKHNDTFKPNDNAKRGEIAQLAVEVGKRFDSVKFDAGKLTQAEIEKALEGYKDVDTKAWYARPMAMMKLTGVMSGYELADGTKLWMMGPGDHVTREQVAAIVDRVFSVANVDKAVPTFTDVPKTRWSYDEIEGLAAQKLPNGQAIVSGYGDGRFGPGDLVTRAQLITMLYRAEMKFVGGQATAFEVTNVEAVSAGELKVCFSMEPNDSEAVNTANYQIQDSNGTDLSVTEVTIDPDNGKCVWLTTGDQGVGEAYMLKIMGVKSGTMELTKSEMGFKGYSNLSTGSLDVELAAESPDMATLATKTANNEVLVVDFTAGKEAVEISGVKVTKLGIYNDSSVKVVAYDHNGLRLSNGVTFSDGVADLGFSVPLEIGAGETETLHFKLNISGTATGTIGLKVAAEGDVTANTTDIGGSFPVQGATFPVIDGSAAVATGTVDVMNIASTERTVEIGEVVDLTKLKVSETSSKEPLMLKSLTLFNNGSAAEGDIKGYKLVDQNGQEVATAEEKGKLVHFTLGGDGYELAKGTSKNFTVRGTVANGATRTVQMLVQNDFDIELVGKTTGASILATAENGGLDSSFPIGDLVSGDQGYNQVKINEGSLTVSKANNSPSGDVALGAQDVVLGAFELKAAGEDIELQKMQIDLGQGGDLWGANNTSGAMECESASVCDLTGSVKVMVDADKDLEGEKTLLTVSAATPGLWGDGGALTTFDLSSFQTIKAGTGMNLLIVGTVNSDKTETGEGEFIKVGVKGIYHYKKSSNKYGTAAASTVFGNQLSVIAGGLTVSKNLQYGDQTKVAGSDVMVGSFVVKAVSEQVNVTSVTIKGATTCGGAGVASGYTNMELREGANTLSTEKATVTLDGTTANTYAIGNNKLNLTAGQQKTVDVYADIASGATNLCLTLGVNAVSGSGQTSQTTVEGPLASTNLQLISIPSGGTGTLTVTKANETPVSKQFVAGTSNNEVLRLKLSATPGEDLYLTKVRFNVESGIANAGQRPVDTGRVLFGSSEANMVEVGANSSWQDVAGTSSRIQSLEFSFSGAGRPKIPANGTMYLALQVKFASSSQYNVTDLSPVFTLADLEASGNAALTAGGTGGNAQNTTGMIVTPAGNVTATYTDGGGETLGAAVAGAATTVIATSNSLDLATGDVIFIDANGDNTWDAGTEELMTVVEDQGANVVVMRGAFGTTPQAAYADANANDDIFILNGVTALNRVSGNTMKVYNTKPVITSVTSLAQQSQGLNKEIFKFNVAAAMNEADGGSNPVELETVDITLGKSGVTVNNVRVYPTNDGTGFEVACAPLSGTEWRCPMSALANSKNQISEGLNRTYAVRADIGVAVTENNSLQTYIGSLGTIAAAGDVVWADGDGTPGDVRTTGISWVYQEDMNGGVMSEIQGGTIPFGTGSGTTDTTAPIITAINFNDLNGNDELGVGNQIVLTFSEAIDPTTIAPGLVPGGAPVAIANGATGDLSTGDGNPDFIQIRNIIGISLGNTTAVTAVDTADVLASLNSAGTVLTLEIDTDDLTLDADEGTLAVMAGSGGTTVKDANGNAMTAAGSNGAAVEQEDL